MKPAPFRYVRARTVDEAISALRSENDAKVLAGGQSLIAMMNLRAISPEVLVDINRITDLDYITERGDAISIGALTRQCSIKASPIIAKHCPLLTEAHGLIANKTVRNRGTIGGNVCHADPASETPAVLVTTGASMVIQGGAEKRTVPAEKFFCGVYETAVGEDELLVEVRVPKAMENEGSAIMEVSSRKGDFGIAVVACVVRITDGTCDSIRLACSGVSDKARRIEGAEKALTGKKIDADAISAAGRIAYDAVDPQSDFHGDAIYRRELIETLTCRAVKLAAGRAAGVA